MYKDNKIDSILIIIISHKILYHTAVVCVWLVTETRVRVARGVNVIMSRVDIYSLLIPGLWRRLVREQLGSEARNSGQAHQYTTTCTELDTDT